jgi:hypothetical protein
VFVLARKGNKEDSFWEELELQAAIKMHTNSRNNRFIMGKVDLYLLIRHYFIGSNHR